MKRMKTFLIAVCLVVTMLELSLVALADDSDSKYSPYKVGDSVRLSCDNCKGSHYFTVVEILKPANCSASGSYRVRCLDCGYLEFMSGGSAHYYYIVSSTASCTTSGRDYVVCSVCGATNDYYASSLGHNWGEEIERKPTCTVQGSVYQECSRCDSIKQISSSPVLDHTWSETSRIPATCLPGSIKYTCSTCNQTKTESISARENAHTYEIAEIVPATYDSDGNMISNSYIRYACSICGDSYNSTIGGSGISGPIINEGDGGSGMQDSTAAVGKAFLSGIWALFGIYVPGFSFTFGQMWLGVLLCSISILVVRLIFGFGGTGPGGVSSRTSSTNNPKISKERRHDEF